MKKWIIGLVCGVVGGSAAMGQVVISQYVETESGTRPKGIEIWNPTDSDIIFDGDSNLLDVKIGVNGGAPASSVTVNTGTLAAGDVIVIGTDDMSPDVVKAFTFNGNDSIVVELGGVVQDVFGNPGEDPGTAWSGNGVSTANQNIQLLAGITTGNTVGWTDPSTRFETVSTTPSTDLTGFGVAPGGSAAFSVSLDKTDGFTVEQGTQDTIVATAANGTAPYSYDWDTDMAEGDYTASGDTFTILSTAALGDYSATVTATDAESETASNTVTFSVVAPPTKYAISIVTNAPGNGTVTTTPATEAAEGVSVTVNAVPADGFAVGTITVTAADSSNVPVSGNTFTMPSQDVTVTVTFEEFTAGTYVVDFEGDGETKSSYASGTVTLSGMNWDMTEAMIGTLDGDWKNGARSARMRGYAASSMTMLEDLAGGVGTLSFSYRRYSTDSQVDWKVEYSTDGGGNWTQVGSDFTAPASDDVQTFSEAINSSGNTRIRIKRATETGASTARLNIDDITMTPGGPAEFNVSVNKSNGFTVEQGTQDTIVATAANGTAPYRYAWDTDMVSGFATNGNVFTILDTAPVGDYYATVTATDAESETAEKTVTFSVVEPVPAEGIVDFRFNEAPYLQVTAKDANLTVSDMALSAGTIETAVDTGTYFPDEPYIEESGGWTATSQAEAKAFIFTITPGEGAAVTIEGISFNAYATAAGPSAFGFDINGVATYEVDAPSASLLSVSQAVAGVVSETGAIEVKIQGWLNGSRESSGSGTFRLDDVVIHGSVSTGPLEFSVNLNKSNGFTVEQGTQDTIVATAANGTAPYSYDWDTDMAEGDYTASGDTFTILSTAALGSYSATVTATDASDPVQTASNTVTFSVVAPPTKYAISIVTNAPGNGTVTTTPATEAAEGVSVTVNATPADGFAVESIVVNGGAVAVTDGAFTMPAGPVTVTVNFMVYEGPGALITFETGTLPTAYADNTAVLEDGKTWATRRVVRGNLEGDKKIGTLSSRLYPVTTTNAYLQQTEAYAEPITKLSFWVASYGNDNMANVVLLVQVSSDGETWETVETLSGAADITAELVEHVIDEIPDGAVYVRFFATAEATSGKHINIDDIGLYFGEPAFSVSLNKSSGFQVQEGQSDSIVATAANGTAPYSYAWDSTLGAAHYTASGDTFTILATAPTGSYSATVTATDSSDPAQEAQRTVTFSVVGLPPGQPAVIISGSLSGTVGVRMELVVSVTNETATVWSVSLKNPLGEEYNDWEWGNFPPIFAFTPNQAGDWTLSATAETGSGTISNTVTLTISEGGGGDEPPPIPPITFIVGTGFSFELPAGHAVARMEAAGTATDAEGEFMWSEFTDYSVGGSTVTISSTGAAARVIRVYFNVTP